ncbi:putative E3 SUMO-protein ligase [Encephalitozoon cuniculi]|nr:putative E3 SUMO-protein ligase [Encephalitozoon cuniculi]
MGIEEAKGSDQESTCSEREQECAAHAHGDSHGARGEMLNDIFKPVELKDLRSDRTIFQDLGGEKKQPRESEFLRKPVVKSSGPAKNEIPGVVLKAGANLHKFVGEWESIGTGVVYVTKNKEKRCFFIRDGVMLSAFDFLVTYDVRPTKKRLGVCIVVREMAENKCVEQLYCVVFRSESDADEFVRAIKT